MLRHETRAVLLQSYGFHLGRASHALQDSLSHTLRDPMTGAVRHVLNYVDPATAPDYDPHQDGYPHQSGFDDCRDEANAERTRQAKDATRELASAIVAARDTSQRLEGASAVLDRYLTRDPDCTPDNGWCGSVQDLPTPASCSQAPCAPALALLALLLLPLAKRGRRNIATMIALVAGLQAAMPAAASEGDQRAIGVAGKLGVALDNGAVATAVGLRWRPQPALGLGVDLEMNPWLDFASGTVAAGTANAIVSATYDWLSLRGASIRSGASAGASMLLFDAAGARVGDIGPHLGVSLLALSLPLGNGSSFDIEPMSATLSVPHIGGVPLAYKQYRFNLGVTWML